MSYNSQANNRKWKDKHTGGYSNLKPKTSTNLTNNLKRDKIHSSSIDLNVLNLREIEHKCKLSQLKDLKREK